MATTKDKKPAAKKETFEEKRLREAEEKLQSDAIARLYKTKKQFDNSKNTRY